MQCIRLEKQLEKPDWCQLASLRDFVKYCAYDTDWITLRPQALELVLGKGPGLL